MMKIFWRRPPKVDPDELDRQTAEVQEFLEKEGPNMSAVAKWLNNRKGQNGLGEDFDITFYPKGVS
jgi:hypothetical protein